ncbi:MAG: glycoside hydrolase family 3 C-terminal domain-containing protein [bacterium]|nr:glycoside hydrolase family 3 C-terminal domain-containing protein [bacterium]
MSNYKTTPLWDDTLPIDERLDYVIKELTLEEKMRCMTPSNIAIERLNIRSFSFGGEAAHGIEARHDNVYSPGTPISTTSFTEPIGLSYTWDYKLLEKVGEAIGNEGRIVFQKEQNGGLSRWAPTIDMARDPRWGRTEECYGEDPYLTGTLASSYITGLQGRDPFYLRVGATLKHFYANNTEKDRICTSSSIDPRNKHEYYLEPFRLAVTKGHAESLMTAYNEINGIPAMLNKEVQTIVKDTWGLRGHVVTDGLDVNQTVNNHHYFTSHADTIKYGLEAGIDCFTDDPDYVYNAVKDAFDQGLITEEDLNRALRRQFATRIRFGLYDYDKTKNPYFQIKEDLLGSDKHKALALEAAEKSLVLLKNEGDLLPLSKEDCSKRIGVIGPLANVWNQDWYGGLPMEKITILDGLKELIGTDHLAYENGLNEVRIKTGTGYIGLDADGTAILTDRTHSEVFLHTDWGNNAHTFISKTTGNYLKAPTYQGIVTALHNQAFGWYISENFHLKQEEDLTYLTSWNFLPVLVGKDAILQTGEVTDASIPVILELEKDGLQEAVKLAKDSDLTILCLGCHPMINGKEEVDRPDLDLPEMQETLLKAVYQANSNVILVLTSNYPYTINWANDHVPSILLTATGSQCLGRAVANAITGRCCAGGRLSMTWYKDSSSLPAINDYDIIHSNRTYQYCEQEVLYPFGYGCSYGDFTYDHFSVKQEEDQIQITFTVIRIDESASPLACDEVVQLYVRQLNSRVKRPMKQLKAFTRISLKPQEETKITFTLPLNDLRYYSTIVGRMYLESGNYSIMVGSSSEDIHLKKTISITGEPRYTRNPYDFTLATMYDQYENAMLYRGYKDLEAVYPKDAKKHCELIYEDYAFTKQPTMLLLDAHIKTTSFVTVTLAHQIIAAQILPPTASFECCPIRFTHSGLHLPQEGTLKLSINGDFACTRFRFQ